MVWTDQFTVAAVFNLQWHAAVRAGVAERAYLSPEVLNENGYTTEIACDEAVFRLQLLLEAREQP
ncbi:MAG: hypothetical protein BGO13_11655 [Burkholderiales bacterium 66-5]|nr:MAG: hypothetical protein BGO13_11655 [Burkholderiales bacterium 66-5]